MPGRDKIFIFYLQNTATGECYYRDVNGNTQKTSIMAAGEMIDISLPNAPSGWMETELGFMRNATYKGFNRSFSSPLKLVKDAKVMVQEMYYNGVGTETPLSLLILKRNPNPKAGEPLYKKYYKAPLDLSKKSDVVGESFQVNMLDGDLAQLVKTYDKTTFQIPCDGSIEENIKINADGTYLPDVLTYQFIQFSPPGGGHESGIFGAIPVVLVGEDGDSFGVQKGNPQFEQFTEPLTNDEITAYYAKSGNFLLSKNSRFTVEIEGYISVRPGLHPTRFDMYLATSKSIVGTDGSTSHSVNLIQPGHDGFDNYVQVTAPSPYYFKQSITLDKNENLFLMGVMGDLDNTVTIIGGAFQVRFNSKPLDTSVWGISVYDLGVLLMKNICAAAKTQFQTFNFGFKSDLLNKFKNIVITSGDAIRASGDTNYNRFFNAIQNNPNFPNINEYFSYGPVIKTTLADFFAFVNAVFCACMGNEQKPGEGEKLFIEDIIYVYDSSKTTFDLGEVGTFKVDADSESLITGIKIGYKPQNYDQKAGKYEWNTTLEMLTPIKSIASKLLEIISPYRADSYGFERLRADIDSTSTTRNTGDSDVFAVACDYSKFILDYFKMSFVSSNQDPTDSNNSNLRLIPNNFSQGLPMTVDRPGYFNVSSDPTIFILAQKALLSTWVMTINISGHFQGQLANLLTGTPVDFVRIDIVVDGIIFQTLTQVVTGASTAISMVKTINRTWATDDCFYVLVTTSTGAITTLDSVIIDLNSGYITVSGSAITIDPGTNLKPIGLPIVAAPTVSGLPVVSYGFQYFQFSEIVRNNNFSLFFDLSGIRKTNNARDTSQRIIINLYLNGLIAETSITNATPGWTIWTDTSLSIMNRAFQNGDLVWVVADVEDLNADILDMSLLVQSNVIKAYDFDRPNFSSILGIPNIPNVDLPDGTQIFDPTKAGAPFNIVLSPKRCLLRWLNYLASVLYFQRNSALTNAVLSKNNFMQTTLDGVTIKENADVQLSDGVPFFYPETAKITSNVPATFSEVQTGAANSYVTFTSNGKPFGFFPNKMKQRPALNEMQEWEGNLA